MEITVLWADSAIAELQDIHDYYITKVGIKVAHKITNSIVDKSLSLTNHPRIGAIEELLNHKKEEIRYLVDGNYKIVYLIEQQIVLITTIFDCRQNPDKLKKKKI
jgi:plasmid stabilization system protein ParE